MPGNNQIIGRKENSEIIKDAPKSGASFENGEIVPVMKNKKNVLIVDDDKINHLINQRLIDSMDLGNEIHRAFNA